jgi:putative addiction module component (TIGR02574 family)
MDIATLEREVLKLSAEERARLARELLDSLDRLPSQDIDRLWLEEASRRAAQLDAGEANLVPGDEADRKARALLR